MWQWVRVVQTKFTNDIVHFSKEMWAHETYLSISMSIRDQHLQQVIGIRVAEINFWLEREMELLHSIHTNPAEDNAETRTDLESAITIVQSNVGGLVDLLRDRLYILSLGPICPGIDSRAILHTVARKLAENDDTNKSLSSVGAHRLSCDDEHKYQYIARKLMGQTVTIEHCAALQHWSVGCFELALNTQCDIQASIYFRTAAEMNHPIAQLMMGFCPDLPPESQTMWLERSALQGNTYAQVQLGRRLIDVDRDQGIYWLEMAANAGDSMGQCILRDYYDQHQMDDEYFRWLKKLNDNPVALAACYVKGRGCPINLSRALRLLETVAGTDDQRAEIYVKFLDADLKELGELQGVQESKHAEDGVVWLLVQGFDNVDGDEALRRAAQRMTSELQVALARALQLAGNRDQQLIRWLELVADYNPAARHLLLTYYSDHAMDADYFRWLQDVQEIAICLIQGKGCEQDVVRGVEILEKIAGYVIPVWLYAHSCSSSLGVVLTGQHSSIVGQLRLAFHTGDADLLSKQPFDIELGHALLDVDNDECALQWFEMLAHARGNLDAAQLLLDYYEEHSMDSDYFKWLKVLGTDQVEIARCYMKGRGCEPSMIQAINVLEALSDLSPFLIEVYVHCVQTSELSMPNTFIGDLVRGFQDGRALQRTWHWRSAYERLLLAQALLCAIPEKGLVWLECLALNGDGAARELLVHYHDTHGNDVDYFRWQSDPLAIARCYIDGRGCDRDVYYGIGILERHLCDQSLPQLLEFYVGVRDLDKILAVCRRIGGLYLAVCYMDGIGVRRDRRRTKRLINKSSHFDLKACIAYEGIGLNAALIRSRCPALQRLFDDGQLKKKKKRRLARATRRATRHASRTTRKN